MEFVNKILVLYSFFAYKSYYVFDQHSAYALKLNNNVEDKSTDCEIVKNKIRTVDTMTEAYKTRITTNVICKKKFFRKFVNKQLF